MAQIAIVLGIADGQTARVGNTRLAAQPACDLTGWWGNPRHSQDNMTITQVWYLFFFPSKCEFIPQLAISFADNRC